MVKCKACKKPISQYSEACPHCGQKNPTGNGLLVIVSLFAIILTITYLTLY